ncbi:MAG: hypothetical protein KJ676_04615 [Alphaproteobacteria bacterium]|nr:hypothetical protein [Alphaproteobacteria bacterium]MBU1527103.1 hypothetical protein [Alphaproteobacteria bacterium]MBU2350701.1 hypothetical protein [Alphaproteobacteria bacterium]MBU2383318.1 hypothetical protein [Alphaproteobacteria bacterium]
MTMSDTGDRQPPKDPTPGHDPDDLVGFASPASLAGRPRAPEPEPKPEAVVEPTPEPKPAAEPVDARAAFEPAAPPPPPEPAFGRRDREPVPEAPMGLYAIYALILFAVPTLGVSAVVGLLAVLFGDAPAEEPFTSHHLYQRRTLWTAAIAAVAGVILIVVNLGVFVLFVLVGWLVVRGAWGVFLLTRGRPVPNPRGWWVG